jgi:predicted O-linked N-acetylglucosamine transferase (SPINDLY family)
MVDLNVYGPAIDLMCDTFPFIGGNACREVSAHGTPVIAKLGTSWDALLRKDRNPDLLARNEDEYIALAVRMADDGVFRARQRDVALEKATEYTDPQQMIEDVEAAIAACLADD